MKSEDMKVGSYYPREQEKGENEALIEGLKEGDTYWTVRLSKYGWYDCRTQYNAEVLSRMVLIDRRLNRMEHNIIELRKLIKGDK